MSQTLLTITQGTHFFKLTKISPRVKPIVIEFARRYIKYGLVRTARGSFKKEAAAVFGAATKDREEYRFHINQLSEFESLLSRYRITGSVVEKFILEVPKGEQVEIPIKPQWVVRDYQEPVIDYLERDQGPRSRIVQIQTGKGKGQPLSARIKVPGGWSTIGEMTLGTDVTAKDGTTTKVNGVFPQGLKPVYVVTFADGRSTKVDDTHLWKVYYRDKEKGEVAAVLSTLDLLALLEKSELGIFIDLCDPEFPMAEDARGLMARSGNVHKADTRADAEDIQYLIRSQGGIAYLSEEADKTFTVVQAASRSRKLRLISIAYSGEEETQCISIEHPESLYVTDDFIVTHNTFSSLKAISNILQRFVLIVRPMYLDKWAEDVKKYLDIRPDQVMIVRGGAQLQALLHLAIQDKLDDNVAILISNKTFQLWLKAYETFKEDTLTLGYPILPEDFFSTVKAGIRLIDEVHLDLHLQFKLDLYTNVWRSIALSATFLSNDSFIKHVQEVMYPLDTRFNGGELDKYVASTAAFYSIKDMRHVRTNELGSINYSHNAFERSLIKSSRYLPDYLRVAHRLVEDFFMHDYVKGQRCAVYASSIELCTLMTKYFQERYPHLDVRRYVAEDPYENLHTADIVVTTVLSGGTAEDIAMLKTVVMTISMESIQSNIQLLGRLRNIPNIPLRFVYLVCIDIPKQVQYHQSKKELLNQRAKTYSEYFLPFSM